jgi:glutamate receptor 3
MNPVSMEIWLCLSLAYIAVSVVLFLTSRVVNSGWRRRVVRRPSYRSFSYPKSVNDRRKSEIQLQRQKQGSMISIQSNEFPIQIRPSIRRRYHYRTRPLPPQNARDSNSDKNKEEEYEKSSVHLFGISNALFFSFSSFMRQSINLVPKSLSGRVAATSWWYFSLIFVSSYTANLVAFLTVEKLVTPIESVEDLGKNFDRKNDFELKSIVFYLAKQHEIKYGLIRNGTTAAFFEKSNVTLFQHMWMIMQESSSDVLVATNDEAVAKVRSSKGKYAVFIE